MRKEFSSMYLCTSNYRQYKLNCFSSFLIAIKHFKGWNLPDMRVIPDKIELFLKTWLEIRIFNTTISWTNTSNPNAVFMTARSNTLSSRNISGFQPTPHPTHKYKHKIMPVQFEFAFGSVWDWSWFGSVVSSGTHGLTLIPAWISNHTHSKVWDEIIYPGASTKLLPIISSLVFIELHI